MPLSLGNAADSQAEDALHGAICRHQVALGRK